MKRVMVGVIVFVLFFMLSACSSQYEETPYTINGHQIYLYDSKQEICAQWYSMGVMISEDTTFHFINMCPKSYVIKVDGQYISLISYVQDNDVSREELAQLEHGFFTSNANLLEEFGVSLNDFSLESVVLLEFQGEITESGQWDEKVVIDVQKDDLNEELVRILSAELGSKEVCKVGENSMCSSLLGPTPIVLTLMSENNERLVLDLFPETIHIKYYIGEDLYSILNYVSEPKEDIVQLYQTIMDAYKNE